MNIRHPVVCGIKSAIIMILVGVILYEPLISRIRQHYMDGYIEKFEQSTASGTLDALEDVDVPGSPVFAIEGESPQKEESLNVAPSSMSVLSEEPVSSKVPGTLDLIGVIEIPSIDTKVPVWEGVSVKALRFGVGRYPLSSPLGSDHGNCFIMGHRNRHLSTIFCRLQYVKEGAKVYVTTKDSKVIEYEVSKTVAVPPDKVSDYMLDPADGSSRLTLCTCITERGKGWRFIAVCTKSEF